MSRERGTPSREMLVPLDPECATCREISATRHQLLNQYDKRMWRYIIPNHDKVLINLKDAHAVVKHPHTWGRPDIPDSVKKSVGIRLERLAREEAKWASESPST